MSLHGTSRNSYCHWTQAGKQVKNSLTKIKGKKCTRRATSSWKSSLHSIQGMSRNHAAEAELITLEEQAAQWCYIMIHSLDMDQLVLKNNVMHPVVLSCLKGRQSMFSKYIYIREHTFLDWSYSIFALYPNWALGNSHLVPRWMTVSQQISSAS